MPLAVMVSVPHHPAPVDHRQLQSIAVRTI